MCICAYMYAYRDMYVSVCVYCGAGGVRAGRTCIFICVCVCVYGNASMYIVYCGGGEDVLARPAYEFVYVYE